MIIGGIGGSSAHTRDATEVRPNQRRFRERSITESYAQELPEVPPIPPEVRPARFLGKFRGRDAVTTTLLDLPRPRLGKANGILQFGRPNVEALLSAIRTRIDETQGDAKGPAG